MKKEERSSEPSLGQKGETGDQSAGRGFDAAQADEVARKLKPSWAPRAGSQASSPRPDPSRSKASESHPPRPDPSPNKASKSEPPRPNSSRSQANKSEPPRPSNASRQAPAGAGAGLKQTLLGVPTTPVAAGDTPPQKKVNPRATLLGFTTAGLVPDDGKASGTGSSLPSASSESPQTRKGVAPVSAGKPQHGESPNANSRLAAQPSTTTDPSDAASRAKADSSDGPLVPQEAVIVSAIRSVGVEEAVEAATGHGKGEDDDEADAEAWERATEGADAAPDTKEDVSQPDEEDAWARAAQRAEARIQEAQKARLASQSSNSPQEGSPAEQGDRVGTASSSAAPPEAPGAAPAAAAGAIEAASTAPPEGSIPTHPGPSPVPVADTSSQCGVASTDSVTSPGSVASPDSVPSPDSVDSSGGVTSPHSGAPAVGLPANTAPEAPTSGASPSAPSPFLDDEEPVFPKRKGPPMGVWIGSALGVAAVIAFALLSLGGDKAAPEPVASESAAAPSGSAPNEAPGGSPKANETPTAVDSTTKDEPTVIDQAASDADDDAKAEETDSGEQVEKPKSQPRPAPRPYTPPPVKKPQPAPGKTPSTAKFPSPKPAPAQPATPPKKQSGIVRDNPF